MERKTFIYKITSARKDFLEAVDEAGNNYMRLHFAYLNNLLDKGILVLAGPCVDTAFGIAIYYADSEDEARTIMENDPVVKNKVMNAELHEFRISLMK